MSITSEHRRASRLSDTVGSLLVFLVLCYLLHSRDRVVAENKAAKAIPAKTST